jgi:hypothetical protein
MLAHSPHWTKKQTCAADIFKSTHERAVFYYSVVVLLEGKNRTKQQVMFHPPQIKVNPPTCIKPSLEGRQINQITRYAYAAAIAS